MYRNKMAFRWSSGKVQFIFPQLTSRRKILWIGVCWNGKTWNRHPAIRSRKRDWSVAIDYGATTTLSNTLFNMIKAQQCSVKISLACRGLSIKATHRGYKTYYITVTDVTGVVHKCTTKSYFGPATRSFSWTPLNADHRVILDKDSRIAGFFFSNKWRDSSSNWTTIARFRRSFLSWNCTVIWNTIQKYVKICVVALTAWTLSNAYSAWYYYYYTSCKGNWGTQKNECHAFFVGKAHLEIRPLHVSMRNVHSSVYT